MTVTQDTIIDQTLRSGKVGIVRVYKCSGNQIIDSEVDAECGVGRNGVIVLGEGEFDTRLSGSTLNYILRGAGQELTMLSTEGISPIGVGLQDPVLT